MLGTCSCASVSSPTRCRNKGTRMGPQLALVSYVDRSFHPPILRFRYLSIIAVGVNGFAQAVAEKRTVSALFQTAELLP